MKKDFSTRDVELAWVVALRRYSPVILVLCVAVLLGMVIFIPTDQPAGMLASVSARLILLLIYAAFAALAVYLFIETRQREESVKAELADAAELYGLSERLTTTLQSLGEGVIATDVDGLVTLINDSAIQLTGWARFKALGAPAREVFRIIHEEDRKPIDDPTRAALSTGKRVREDTTALLIARNGKENPIAFHAAPILDTDGWIIGAVLVFQDVTGLRAVQRHREQLIDELSKTNEKLRTEVARREEGRRAAVSLMQDAQMAQAALRESEERLRVLFEGIDDALFVSNAEGRILQCNPAACSILGYERDGLLRMNLREIAVKPAEAGVSQSLVTRRGQRIPVHVHTSVIRYGGVDAFLTVARDITEMKVIQDELRASNEQLRESNAALEEYARVASHDLQEPLRKIESFSQVLLEDYGGKIDTRGREYLDIMVNSAHRMRRLIRDVLAFSRAGTADRPFSAVDLNKVMTIVKDNLSERIHERHAIVDAGALPTIFGDETQMVQVLQNLVGNGLKFNEKASPRVEVRAQEDGDSWRITVKDDGIGMRASEAQMIFAPFKRLHSQDRFEGTGIGLAICRRIVARHGGTIGVESELHKGSTFWLTLPKATEQLRKGNTETASADETQHGETHEPHHDRAHKTASG